MKRTLLVVSLAMCAARLVAITGTYSYTSKYTDENEITWRYTTLNGEVQVGGNNSYDPAVPRDTIGAITIPSTINGLPVTGINTCAFQNCTNLTSITIPAGVTNIALSAFQGCNKLESVLMPESLLSIEGLAFSNCDSLMSIEIPSKVKVVPNLAFQFCRNLESVVFPDGLTQIGADAFYGCESLKEIVIPEGVTNIQHGAFFRCSSLESLTLPNSIKACGNAAFRFCNSIKSVNLAQSFFDGCMRYHNGEDPELSTTNIETVIVKEGTSNISATFRDFIRLKSIYIPASVTNIVDGAFNDCSVLEQVSVNTNNLAYSSINGLLLDRECTILIKGICGDIIIPDGVLTIGDRAFYNCSGLTNISMPNSITNIGANAFYNCSNLTSVSIPNSVTRIGDWAFSGCGGLTSVAIPNSVTSMGGGAFSGCRGLTNVTIPNSVKSIGGSAFSDCSGLTSVVMPDFVASISPCAFAGCGNLTSVVMPNSVSRIEDCAFAGCSNLTSIVIPNSVISIGNGAFSNCSSMVCVAIPRHVSSIGRGAFSFCSGLQSFTVDNDNKYFTSANGLLLDKLGKVVVQGVIASGNVEIPVGVTTIGSGAFSDCVDLTSVAIPNSVTNIKDSAFYNCSGLKSVSIPGSVTSIGHSAFSKCINLNIVCISDLASWCEISFLDDYSNPLVYADELWVGDEIVTDMLTLNGVSHIGEGSFANFGGLKSVTIPNSITNIEDYAFYCCSNLTRVVMNGDAPHLNPAAFYNVHPDCVIYLPRGNTTYNVVDDRWLGMMVVRYGAANEDTPSICGDEGAVVEESAGGYFILTPSAVEETVNVTIPDGISANKVAVKVPLTAKVKPNGAGVKVMKGVLDIAEFLDLAAVTSSDGVIDIAKAQVRKTIADEALDVASGAEIDISGDDPFIRTSPTKLGLTYTLREGVTLNDMVDRESKFGDGTSFEPTITISRSNSSSGFYTIKVEK